MADKQSINLLIMKKIQLILLLTLSLFLLDCNPVEYTEYYPTEIITYSFQNSSSTDVIFRIYSSDSNEMPKEDGFSYFEVMNIKFILLTAQIRSTCCRMRPRTIRPYPTARYMSSSVPAMREACTTMRFGKKRIIGSS